MDILPFRLNFFKQTELFLMLRQLDQQYNIHVGDFNLRKEDDKTLFEKAGDGHVCLSWPTWELEKKVLRWSFRNHKHLRSPITEKKLNDLLFIKDISNPNRSDSYIGTLSEMTFAGRYYVIDNLIAKGFADSCNVIGVNCIINQKGLSAGALLEKHYKFRNSELCDGTKYDKLIPKIFKKLGYKLLYWTSILLIIYSIFFLSCNLIHIVGLSDEAKTLFSFLYPINVLIIGLLLTPPFFIFLAMLLIIPYKRQ